MCDAVQHGQRQEPCEGQRGPAALLGHAGWAAPGGVVTLCPLWAEEELSHGIRQAGTSQQRSCWAGDMGAEHWDLLAEHKPSADIQDHQSQTGPRLAFLCLPFEQTISQRKGGGDTLKGERLSFSLW